MKQRYTKSFYVLPVIACGILTACNSQPSQPLQATQCPQVRTTEMAPAASSSLSNPLPASAENIAMGKTLYSGEAKPLACVECHGKRGDGNGRMAYMFEPAPRNFTCSNLTSKLSDGQYFWIIKNGSIGTSMPAFDKLNDKQIWQLTHYLRTFEK